MAKKSFPLVMPRTTVKPICLDTATPQQMRR